MIPLTAEDTSSHEPTVVRLVDRDRFHDVYRAELDFVWRSLRRLGVPEAHLDDAAHEVFIVAFRKLELFEGRSSFKTWLFGIALRVAQKLARSARRSADALAAGRVDSDTDGPHELVARRQQIRTLHALLAQLDPDQRAVFIMMELEQMTASEVAEVTKAPLNTVYSRLRLARREFDGALRRYRARNEERGR